MRPEKMAIKIFRMDSALSIVEFRSVPPEREHEHIPETGSFHSIDVGFFIPHREAGEEPRCVHAIDEMIVIVVGHSSGRSGSRSSAGTRWDIKRLLAGDTQSHGIVKTMDAVKSALHILRDNDQDGVIMDLVGCAA